MDDEYWETLIPNTLRAAISACAHFALQTHNLSVDRIADRMRLNSKFTLYKWMETGRMPAIEIPNFERACGANYVTKFLAHGAHCLSVDIPSGQGRSEDIRDLQIACAEAITTLLKFHRTREDESEVLDQLKLAMSYLAYHHADIEKAHCPEFDY